jgi:type I restriction enzyme S subunit
MRFPTTRLGTVSDFIRGVSFKPDDVQPLGTENTIACFRTKNVQAEIDLNDVWAVPCSAVNRGEQILQEGDLLISSANSWNLVGKCCWVPRLDWPATLGGFISALRPKRAEVFPRFLYHWFSFAPVQAKLRGCARQTTNISNLDLNQALDLRIPLPPMEGQRRIAAILDKADALRQKRRTAHQKLDSLTQSIFIDIFGDPATNPKGWPIITIRELLESASYGSSDKASDTGAYPMLRMNNLTFDGRMNLSALKYIDPCLSGCHPRPQDVGCCHSPE